MFQVELKAQNLKRKTRSLKPETRNVKPETRTILAVDCGSVTTQAVLIEKQNNIYRLAAAAKAFSSHGSPGNDITLGVADAIEKIESLSGRRLLNQTGEPFSAALENEGADVFAALVSAAQPLRVLLAGLTQDVGLATARRAIASTYVTVTAEIALDNADPGGEVEQKIAAIQQTQPDVILLVGGTDGGAREAVMILAQIIETALKDMPVNARPRVLYAGNTELRTELAEMIGGLSDFKSLNNILPTVRQADLDDVQAEIELLYQQLKLSQLPGFDTLTKWAANQVSTTAKSFAQSIHYLGQSYNINVLGVDIGSASAAIAARRKGLKRRLTRADVGVGSSLSALLAQVKTENLTRWLPFEISEEALQDFLRNQETSPQRAPAAYREILLKLSVVREALRLMLAQAKSTWQANETRRRKWSTWDLIVGSGQPLTQLPHPALAALALLDALEPAGIFSLALDAFGLVGMLGGIASVEPLAAAQVAGYDALLNLGTVIAPFGIGRPGKTALKVKMTYRDKPELEMEIPFGAIEVIPLGANEKADLEVRVARNFGLHPDGGSFSRKMTAVVEGGVLGVIVDTRGRPIVLPDEDNERRRQLQEWLEKLAISKEQLAINNE